MPRARKTWSLSEAAEWRETRREPTGGHSRVSGSEFEPVEMFDVGQTSKDLAARGIHSDAEGRYWHKDIRRAFPPKGRGRPRTKGIVVRQHSKGKIDAELPGRAQALARFILHNDPVRRELVAEHYAREIRNQPNVIYPEKSYGFARVYRLALEEAMREAAFYDELEGGTAWQDHVAAWNRFRSRSKISKAD